MSRPVPQPGAGPPPIGSRREARETALGLLYEAELRAERPTAALDRQAVPPHGYATELVEGVDEHLAEIDELIGDGTASWPLERLAAIDRNVLRLAVYELVHRPEVPTGVVIAEAVELASQYSTEASGRFVNGVLAALARRLRPDQPA